MSTSSPGLKRILVTGGTGFIGRNLLEAWKDRYRLVPVSFSRTAVDDIAVVAGDCIVHLAGIAHQKKGTDPALYFSVNYEKALAFARRAKEKGASHFIYLSSTKVYGVNAGMGIREDSPCHPADAYGRSKLQAEEALSALADADFTVSHLRPPLVYGAGVKGNMLTLLRLTASGRPLPFKGVNNERSIVYVGNLLAMLEAVIAQRAGGVFIPADDSPYSTFAMLKLLKEELGTRNAEVPVPRWMTSLVRGIRPALGAKVFGSLVYDNRQSKEKLHFANPFTTRQGFAAMVRWFRNNLKTNTDAA